MIYKRNLRATLFLFFLSLFILHFESEGQVIWRLNSKPSGVKQVYDIEYTPGTNMGDSRCYIATDNGLFFTDMSFSQPARTWTKVTKEGKTFSEVFTDLQFMEDSDGSKLIVSNNLSRSNSMKVGIVQLKTKPKEYNIVSITSAATYNRGNSTQKRETIAKVYGKDKYIVMSGHGEVQSCDESDGKCISVTLSESKRPYSFSYGTDNSIFLGGSKGRIFQLNKGSDRYESARTLFGTSVRKRGKDVVEIIPGSNGTVYSVTEDAYVHKATNNGKYDTNWKYYSHGLKPQDDDYEVYSFLQFRKYLYISTNRGIFYTSTTNSQANWKMLENSTRFKGKEVRLFITPLSLVAFNVNDGVMWKTSWK